MLGRRQHFPIHHDPVRGVECHRGLAKIAFLFNVFGQFLLLYLFAQLLKLVLKMKVEELLFLFLPIKIIKNDYNHVF